MDNMGFVVDENHPPEGHVLSSYVAVEGTRQALGGRGEEDPELMAPVNGTKTQKEIASAMPAQNLEETALLGMDDVELKNIKLQFPSSLRLATNEVGASEQRVRTDRGDVVVAVQGDRAKPAILTYHDIGLNCTSFLPFFNYIDMRPLVENFCVLHVNAPGQEDGAPTLPDDFAYPSLDEMANQLKYVLAHFGLKSIIGFGVGAGAHVLAKFAITNPEKVDALTLINCSSYQSGWVEWAYQKMNARALRSRGVTQTVLDYLMWYHFGRCVEERNPDLGALYRSHFARNVNPANLAHYVEAYIRRTDLGIARDAASLRPPVLNVTGALSPHVDDTVAFNARLNPNNSTWMKIQDCGLVIEEQPAKISEAFRLFLQGEGYVPPRSPCKLIERRASVESAHRRASVESAHRRVSVESAHRRVSVESAHRRAASRSPAIRITANPFCEAVVC